MRPCYGPAMDAPANPWIFHHRMREDVVHRVGVDSSFAAAAPDADMPVVTRVSVPLKGESDYTFDARHDRMLDAIVRGLQAPPRAPWWRRLVGGEDAPNPAVFVGRLTRAGTVELYFYSARAFPKHVLVALEERAPGQRFEVESRPDPEWSEYIETLHPGPAHLPLLVSWALLDVRARANDDVAREREVDHTLLFTREDDVVAFLAAFEEPSRSVRRFELDDGEHRLGVDVTLRHSVDRVTTDLYVRRLASFALAHGGVYDGWGAVIVAGRPRVGGGVS